MTLDCFMLTVIIPCICKNTSNYRKIVTEVLSLDYVKKVYVCSTKALGYNEDERVELIKTDSDYYNNVLIKEAVQKVETEFLAIIPDSFLLKARTVNFAFQSQKSRPDGMVVIGLEDNVVNENNRDEYTSYRVYDNKIGPKDYEICSFYKTTNLFVFEENPIAADLNNHYVTAFMQKNTYDRKERVTFVVNERFDHDSDYDVSLDSSFLHDIQVAKNLALVRKKKLSFFQKIFSLTFFEGYNYINILGFSIKFKIRHKPIFTEDCHNYNVAKDIRKIKHKRACIFASFTRHGFIAQETLHYLEELRKHIDYIVYVADSRAKDEAISEIEKIADALIIGRHEEYDFGSYKRGFALLEEKGILDNIDNLLICNDSVDFVGNSDDLKDIFSKAQDFDAYGICTATYGFGNKIKRHKYEWVKAPHIQSYFVNFKKNVFTSQVFKDAIHSIRKIKHKTDIIREYEMGLTRFLDKNGFTHGSYYPYDDTCVVNPYAIYLNDAVDHPILVKHMTQK